MGNWGQSEKAQIRLVTGRTQPCRPLTSPGDLIRREWGSEVKQALQASTEQHLQGGSGDFQQLMAGVREHDLEKETRVALHLDSISRSHTTPGRKLLLPGPSDLPPANDYNLLRRLLNRLKAANLQVSVKHTERCHHLSLPSPPGVGLPGKLCPKREGPSPNRRAQISHLSLLLPIPKGASGLRRKLPNSLPRLTSRPNLRIWIFWNIHFLFDQNSTQLSRPPISMF